MDTSLSQKPAGELAALLAGKKISARELMQSCIDSVAAVDDKVGAFLGFDEKDAFRQADESDARRAAGNARGLLDGIPVGLKDNISIKDQPLTCASKMLKSYVSPYDATVTARLRDAGAIVWAWLNMDEFAMGSSTENSARKKTRNPWDTSRIPGGSSGGSAAAVAAGMTPLALGSDTGGSIRQPASHCGVVGIKPTYGRVSRYGVAAYASSLDQVGTISHTVEDAALLLGAISGADRHDGTALANPVPDYFGELKKSAGAKSAWKIGVPKEFLADGLDPEVRRQIDAALDFYKAAGCEIKTVSLPGTAYAVAVYYIISTAEASSNMARFDGIRYGHRSEKATDAVDIYALSRAEGFGDEVKRRIILGTYVLTSGYYDAYYLRAQKIRTLIRDDFMRAFGEVDFILSPVSPTTPFKLGEREKDVLSVYLGDIYTIPVNLAGLPAISVPCGLAHDMPVGFQLIGKPLDELTLLAAANVFEKTHEFAGRRPLM